MSATYDTTLVTDKDWVRFLCYDRDVTRARLQDEEIAALLVEEPNRYFAAARACEMIISRSGGLLEKQVGDLRLKYAGNPEDSYLRYIRSLREEGARRMMVRPRGFRVLGT